MPEVIQINQDTYRIEDDFVRFYLLIGEKRALLIDSGCTITNAKEIVEKLTDLPIDLINTHVDPDHIAGNNAFSTAYMHPNEYEQYFSNGQIHPEPTSVSENQIFDLGNREVEIISIPGHTLGSIALLDKKYRVLFSGDTVQDGRIFMFGKFRNMEKYKQSLLKLVNMKSQFDRVYASHGTFDLPSTQVDELLEVVDKIDIREILSEEVVVHNHKIKQYSSKAAIFLLER